MERRENSAGGDREVANPENPEGVRAVTERSKGVGIERGRGAEGTDNGMDGGRDAANGGGGSEVGGAGGGGTKVLYIRMRG